MTASFHCCGTFPSRQMRVVSRWNSSRMVRSFWGPSFSSSAGSPSGPTAFSFAIAFHRCGNVLLRGLDPEGTHDWLLRQPLRYVGIEHVGFRVQQ